MPHDMEDIFQYETLYETSRKKQSISGDGGAYTPLGTGRKSQYAIGKKTGESSAASGKSTPKPNPRKKRPPTGQTEAKRKPASGGSAHPPRKKPASANPAKKTIRKPTVESAPAAGKATKQTIRAPKKSNANKAAKKKYPARKRKRSARGDMISYVYLGAMAVGGGIKKLFGTRRKRIIAASLLGIALIICCAFGVKSVYSSKTLFSDNGKELDETAIQERIITDEQNKDKVTYFLIVGVDKSQMLTDCIWIMCFDNEAHKMNVMQLPRDTYVGEDSRGLGKINGVYKSPKTAKWCEQCGKEVPDDEINSGIHSVCGTKVSKRTESNINAIIRVINSRLSLPIDHYVLFDFEGFEKVIDAIGGVDILLEEEMKVYPNKKTFITLPAGLNHLDGATALKFMRTRKNYANGDLGRVKGQRRIIKAMLEKVDKMSSLEALKALKAAYGNFKTDMSLEEIRSFIAPVKKCGADSLHMFELPGNDHWVRPHPSYYVCDEERAAEEINNYLLPYRSKITVDDISFPELGY